MWPLQIYMIKPLKSQCTETCQKRSNFYYSKSVLDIPSAYAILQRHCLIYSFARMCTTYIGACLCQDWYCYFMPSSIPIKNSFGIGLVHNTITFLTWFVNTYTRFSFNRMPWPLADNLSPEEALTGETCWDSPVQYRYVTKDQINWVISAYVFISI